MSENYKVYMCTICGLIYDEELGLPEDNIPAGTRWEEVPEDWHCPKCDVDKSQFELMQSL